MTERKSRIIIYLDADDYAYLVWLAVAKRKRTRVVAEEILVLALDGIKKQTGEGTTPKTIARQPPPG